MSRNLTTKTLADFAFLGAQEPSVLDEPYLLKVRSFLEHKRFALDCKRQDSQLILNVLKMQREDTSILTSLRVASEVARIKRARAFDDN